MIRLPVMHGLIDRRILVNFTVDPAEIAKMLMPPFRPKIYKGKAIAGICLIRLKHIRPKGLPAFMGITSENGAHRIAVEWDENGVIREGVYIPRRDTSLWLNTMVGGRLFPGKHHLARFQVKEADDNYHVAFSSADKTHVSIDAKAVALFDNNSIFENLEEASAFFEQGSIGYSPGIRKLEGLKLKAYRWEVTPMEMINVQSSFFENENLFSKGSVRLDNVLLMKNVEHEWHKTADK